MCLIISKPKGVALPIKKHLVEAEKNNPDGIGIAYYKNNGIVRIKKTFRNVHSLYKFLKANITAEDILLIHFRIATSGKVDKGNRHPFPITLNKQLLRKEELSCRFAVAHNGVISQYGGHKKYSDSQKFIIDILANKRIKANLSNGARSAVQNDPELRLYYDRKAEEGKEHGVIMNAVKFKLITRVFAVVNRGTPFVRIRQSG